MENQVIKFCKNNCCPVVEVSGQNIILGDATGPEGTTVWTRNQFKDFIEAAKSGHFDEIIK